MEYPEEEWLLISRLQHYLFCSRQFAILELEQYWSENFFTMSGKVLHCRVDLPGVRSGGRRRVEYSLPLCSRRLGLTGRADAVEFIVKGKVSEVYPIEYKRGKPKTERCDEVQLCAQALCLEEMMNQAIERAFLFYFETRQRVEVKIDGPLRQLTLENVMACHQLIIEKISPPAVYQRRKCAACSVADYCLPIRKEDVSSWKQFEEALE